MSTTVNVVCYKSKVLKNNESPLMIRVCKDRKMKYQSLGISILPKYWDFKANKPTSKCPNKEYIERLIAEKVKVYTDKVIEFKSQEKEFTATSLMEKVNKPVKRKTVQEVFNQYIQYAYLQPIITQYFIDNKSEIWLLFLIAHSKR